MIKYKGVLWKYYQSTLIPVTRPHIEINLNKIESKELLKISGAYFLRWTNEWDRKGGEFWYVIKDEKEDLSDYKSKVRNQIKKGLKNCRVEMVDNRVIAENGYEVYSSAFSRYKTVSKHISEEYFKKSILNSKDLDFWGVYYKNKLIAYAQNQIYNNVCNYSTIKFHPDFFKFYPSYALIYEMNRYYLNEMNFLYVSDGARSIAHQTNIQNFLIQKFRFRKAYCKLNIYYRKDLEVVVKMLYPIRKILIKIDNKLFQKLNILLKQEEIRRSFD